VNKNAALLCIIILTASSLTMVGSAFAQSIPKPSVPEFTIQTQIKDNTTTITLTIRNQPFDAASQYPDGFFYNVAISVDGKNWSELYHVEDAEDWYPQQSNSTTTVLTYVAGETIYYPRDTSQGVRAIPKSGEVAFQVQAMIGHRDRGAFKNGFMPYVFVGETSDWSNTQTITIPSSNPSTTSSPSPTPTPNGEPQQTELLEIFLAVALTVAVIGAGILVYFKKRNHARINKHGEIEESST
jgi:hypothetical protein